MSNRHYPFWPHNALKHMTVPCTNIYYNVEVSATRFPNKPFIIYYDTPIAFAEFKDETERIAGFLQQECGVKAGDRVLLYMQNSPQWVLAYYGILRANAVVVPVNPMNKTEELRHYVQDSDATTAFVPQDLYPQIRPLLVAAKDGKGLKHLIIAAYSDYLKRSTDLSVPDFVKAERQPIKDAGVTLWNNMLKRNLKPGPLTAGSNDLCVMPYTSGTTGHPKGCMHTHYSVMSSLAGTAQWFSLTQDAIYLSVLPLFHVAGMSSSMNGPLYLGATIVLMTRWDRDVAAELIQRYRVTIWQVISTMVVDFLANPQLSQYDLTSIQNIRGGGAAMPEAVAQKLKELTGLDYIEGYGLTETISNSHLCPPHRPKWQCLGIPMFDVDARVVDPETLVELPANQVGEIVIHGPQVMKGYWNNPDATREMFVEIDGKPFIHTGDLAREDEDGYYFMVDRIKRMINASGYKVWPAEVEALMYQHPAILEACVIAVPDERRGETVKAVVVCKDKYRGKISEQDVVEWAHNHIASYKSPRIVEFADALPKTGSGKVEWRKLQEREVKRFTKGSG